MLSTIETAAASTRRVRASSANAYAAMSALASYHAMHCVAAGDTEGALYWQRSAADWSRRAMVARCRLAGMMYAEATERVDCFAADDSANHGDEGQGADYVTARHRADGMTVTHAGWRYLEKHATSEATRRFARAVAHRFLSQEDRPAPFGWNLAG